MKAFTHHHASAVADAVATVTADPDAVYVAGGSNLVDHLKLGITTPTTLVDVRRLALDEVREHDGTLRIGATVRNSDLAAHPVVRQRYAVLSRALLSGASGQIRNQATTAGNLLQRTRCVYFQDVTTPCTKRDLSQSCSAAGGYGRYNAILGASPSCVAVHPSDLAVALSVLDPTVVVVGSEGERMLPYADLHRLPGDDPTRDTTLEHGDLVVAVDLPPLAPGARSTYAKARDRASYAFALVSVAAVLDLDGDTVRDVRLAWGGVAHRPWRAERAEEELRGRRLGPDTVRAAVEAELAGAEVTDDTAYKVAMLHGLTARTLRDLADERGDDA